MNPRFLWALRPTPQYKSGGLGVSDINFLIHHKQIKNKNIVAILSLLSFNNYNNQTFYDKIDHGLAGFVKSQKRMFFKDEQSTNIKQYFNQGIEFIEQNISKGNVLVHCVHGRSRSPTMAIAYMMYNKKIPFLDAFGILKSQQDIIQPNPGFLRQLKQYEMQLGIK